MATKFNLRGDEIQLRLTVNGVLENTIVDIKSGTITVKLTKHFEGYLGRTSESIDEQFDHVEGTLVVHPSSQAIIQLMERIKKRAQRQVAQDLLKINLVCSLQFVNGDRPKIMVPDLKFGDLPLNFGARDQYADVSLDWAAEDYRPIFA